MIKLKEYCLLLMWFLYGWQYVVGLLAVYVLWVIKGVVCLLTFLPIYGEAKEVVWPWVNVEFDSSTKGLEWNTNIMSLFDSSHTIVS